MNKIDADCNFKPYFCCISQIMLFSNTNSKHLTINENNNTCTKPNFCCDQETSKHTKKETLLNIWYFLLLCSSDLLFALLRVYLCSKLLSLHRFKNHGFIFTFYLVNFVSSLVVACSMVVVNTIGYLICLHWLSFK